MSKKMRLIVCLMATIFSFNRIFNMNNAWKLGESTHLEENISANNAVFLFHEFRFTKKCRIQANNSWFIGCTFIESKKGQKKIVADPFSSCHHTTVISKKVACIFGGICLLIVPILYKKSIA